VRYLVSLVIASHIALGSLGFTVQAPHTPKPGSSERKQITDALRSVVEKELAQPVIFRIDALKVQAGWAFLRGAPLQKSGKKMEYRGTPYQKMIEAGTFDDWICALLNQDGKRWRVVEHVIGATDVPFVDWAERHHAPAAIFK
jgi:hypothetical protein